MLLAYFFTVEFRQPQLPVFYCKFYGFFFTVYELWVISRIWQVHVGLMNVSCDHRQSIGGGGMNV